MLICIACRIAAIMLFLIYQDKGVERIMFLWNLKTLRKQKGFSQEELATRLHVVRQTISKWEKNLSVPDADTLIRLAEILEVSVSELLGTKIEKNISCLGRVFCWITLFRQSDAVQSQTVFIECCQVYARTADAAGSFLFSIIPHQQSGKRF